MAKVSSSSIKVTFGKRKEGCHCKRKGPKDKSVKPNKGQG